MDEKLMAKLKNNSVTGGIIGLGYVGLPLVRHLCEAGYKTIGFDVDPDKVEKLNRGESYIRHVGSDWISETVGKGMFEATADFSRLAETDCISICVPTPLDRHYQPDLQYVESTARSIAQYLRPGQLVILESTTYPGTTEELLRPILEEGGLKAGEDFFLAFSPEREDPGNATYTIQNIPKVVGGISSACTDIAADYYSRIFERVVKVEKPAVAEMTKLLENIFRSVNIALVNELKMLCDKMDIDVWEVIHAASTKPFGFMPFYPGPGLGGHCIPIDPFYLTWKAREHDFPTRFIELAGEINSHMPHYVVTRILEALNDRGKTLRGSQVLVLGLSYKKDIDDTRESPSLKIIELLMQRGAHVEYNDPFVPRMPRLRKYDFEHESVELTKDNLNRFDCAVIVTNHSDYDYEFIAEHASLVVDTRNATAALRNGRDNIVTA